mgnify:CR=1 FL=1
MKTNKIITSVVLALSFLMTSCSSSYFKSSAPIQLSDDDRVVHFEYDSSKLQRSDKNKLKKNIVKWAKENPSAKISVEGHCDERGSNSYNKKLGLERAKTVKQYLVKYGIPASRIKTISYGESKPVAKGSNEESWRQNRRAVTLTISKNK